MKVKTFFAECLVILFFPIILITDFTIWIIKKVELYIMNKRDLDCGIIKSEMSYLNKESSK